MDRFWFLTWTTYGTWLPGDDRGFVSNVRVGEGPEVRHNEPGTEYDSNAPGLARAVRARLKCDPIWLTSKHAELLLPQFKETAAIRGWTILATSIMSKHVHLVVGVPGDPEPSDLLRDFKSYGSRALNKQYAKPTSGTWWTESGSKRKVDDDGGLFEVIRYVRDQQKPLVVWLNVEAIRISVDMELTTRLLAPHQGAYAPRSPDRREPDDSCPGMA